VTTIDHAVAAWQSEILDVCDARARCVLCGSVDCPYRAAIVDGRDPARDGTEDCESFYAGCVSFERLAEMCEVPERRAVAL
jgi:hypothetical protein